MRELVHSEMIFFSIFILFHSDQFGLCENVPYTGYVGDWNTNSAMLGLSGRFNENKCVDIPANLSLCNDIGYQKMRLPNLLEHDTLKEVTQQASSWNPLIGIQCHPDTQLFLCSLFSPVCLERRIWPCRSLCEAVKSKCESRMLRWGFPWPEMVRCDKFPLENDLCIPPQMKQATEDNVCEACKQPGTFEAVIDNYCRAEFVLKMKIRKVKTIKGFRKVYFKKKKKFFKKGGLNRKAVKKMVAYITGSQCDCTKANKSKSYSIVMGVRSGDRFVITYINEWLRKNKEFKKALRAMRKDSNLCVRGVQALEARSPTTIKKIKKRGKSHKTGSRIRLNLP